MVAIPDVGFQNPEFALPVEEVVAAYPAAGGWSHGFPWLGWYLVSKENTQRFGCQQYCCVLTSRGGCRLSTAGNPAGTFRDTPMLQGIEIVGSPYGSATGDFDGKGRLDFAVANDVSVFLTR